jgi:hypothetical protein
VEVGREKLKIPRHNEAQCLDRDHAFFKRKIRGRYVVEELVCES